MGDLVSLSRRRKAEARTKKRAQADENAAMFGLSKAEKARRKALIEQRNRRLDDHERERERES